MFSIEQKDEGVVSLGGQIEYQYTVTNKGGVVVEVTRVFDDPLGEINGVVPFTLLPGESKTLFKTASILVDTTNKVTVAADVNGYADSPNDVIWEIFAAGTDTKIGESTFHLSCSDENMNGPEDCGKVQGDGKDKSGFINTPRSSRGWLMPAERSVVPFF